MMSTTDKSHHNDTLGNSSNNNTQNKSYRVALAEPSSAINTLRYALSTYLTQLEPKADTLYLQTIDQLVRALDYGHSCLQLDEKSATALKEYVTIGSGESIKKVTPLVVINNCLMLYRHFNYETSILKTLSKLNNRNELETTYQHADDTKIAPQQSLAINTALTKPVMILSGGPGTGKTTTLANIIQAIDASTDTELTVNITAPTGKASAQLLSSLTEKYLRHTRLHSSTLHRLLGYNPGNRRYKHTANNRLYGDVFIVDEASMINLEMFYHFLIALPDNARLIITGDPKQLPAIDIGSSFTDLIALTQNNIIDIPRVHLSKNFRFAESHGISKLAALIESFETSGSEIEEPEVNNEPITHDEHLNTQLNDIFKDSHTQWFNNVSSSQAIDSIYQCAIANYQNYFNTVQTNADIDKCFNTLNQFRVLCAINNGQLGVQAFNRIIESHYIKSTKPYYHGKAIMVTQNDYQNRLFNGDIGLILKNENYELAAYFPSLITQEEQKGSIANQTQYRRLTISSLPQHETCFAMTTHKSQGSEMEHVLLVLPQESNVLSQELLYTGITRAKESLTLAANLEAIQHCLSKKQHRHSYMRSLLG